MAYNRRKNVQRTPAPPPIPIPPVGTALRFAEEAMQNLREAIKYESEQNQRIIKHLLEKNRSSRTSSLSSGKIENKESLDKNILGHRKRPYQNTSQAFDSKENRNNAIHRSAKLTPTDKHLERRKGGELTENTERTEIRIPIRLQDFQDFGDFLKNMSLE